MIGKCKTVFPLVVVDNQQQKVLFPVLPDHHHQQQFGDYHGFDPHLHYLQVLEEARKEHGRLNYLFTPEIPYYLSKQEEEEERSEKKRKGKRKWWNPSSIFSFKKKWKRSDSPATMTATTTESLKLRDVRPAVKSYSGPIYDAGGGFSCRRSRPATPSRHKGGGDEEFDNEVPYWNLRDLNFSRFSTSAAPIYLVT